MEHVRDENLNLLDCQNTLNGYHDSQVIWTLGSCDLQFPDKYFFPWPCVWTFFVVAMERYHAIWRMRIGYGPREAQMIEFRWKIQLDTSSN